MGAEPTKLGTLAAMLLLAALVGCVPEKAAAPQALVVYPEAEAVAFRQFGEIWQVYYEVPVAYPAESVLKHINASLERASWQPLKNDFLNPHLPSSPLTCGSGKRPTLEKATGRASCSWHLRAVSPTRR